MAPDIGPLESPTPGVTMEITNAYVNVGRMLMTWSGAKTKKQNTNRQPKKKKRK